YRGDIFPDNRKVGYQCSPASLSLGDRDFVSRFLCCERADELHCGSSLHQPECPCCSLVGSAYASRGQCGGHPLAVSGSVGGGGCYWGGRTGISASAARG